MEIRPARVEDIEGAIELFKEFESESLAEYGFHINADFSRSIAKDFVESSFVAVENDKVFGVLAFKIVNNHVSGELIAQEVIWYVTKDKRVRGVKMFKFAEEELSKRGVKFITLVLMGNLNAAKMEEFYTRSGYVFLEKHFIKKVG